MMGPCPSCASFFRYCPPTLLLRWTVSYWLALVTVSLALAKDIEVWIPPPPRGLVKRLTLYIILVVLDIIKPILTIMTLILYRLSTLLYKWAGLEGMESESEKKERIKVYNLLLQSELNKTQRNLVHLKEDEWFLDIVLNRYIGYVLKIYGMKSVFGMFGLRRPFNVVALCTNKLNAIFDVIKQDLVQTIICDDDIVHRQPLNEEPEPLLHDNTEQEEQVVKDRDSTVLKEAAPLVRQKVQDEILIRKRVQEIPPFQEPVKYGNQDATLPQAKISEAALRRKRFAANRQNACSVFIDDGIAMIDKCKESVLENKDRIKTKGQPNLGTDSCMIIPSRDQDGQVTSFGERCRQETSIVTTDMSRSSPSIDERREGSAELNNKAHVQEYIDFEHSEHDRVKSSGCEVSESGQHQTSEQSGSSEHQVSEKSKSDEYKQNEQIESTDQVNERIESNEHQVIEQIDSSDYRKTEKIESSKHQVNEQRESIEHQEIELNEFCEHRVSDQSDSSEHQVSEQSVSGEHQVNDQTESGEHQVSEHSGSSEHQVSEHSGSSEHQVNEQSVSSEHQEMEQSKPSEQVSEKSESDEHQMNDQTESGEHQLSKHSGSSEHQEIEQSKSSEEVSEKSEPDEHQVNDQTETGEHQVSDHSGSSEHQVSEQSESNERQMNEQIGSREHKVHEQSEFSGHQATSEHSGYEIIETSTDQVTEPNEHPTCISSKCEVSKPNEQHQNETSSHQISNDEEIDRSSPCEGKDSDEKDNDITVNESVNSVKSDDANNDASGTSNNNRPKSKAWRKLVNEYGDKYNLRN